MISAYIDMYGRFNNSANFPGGGALINKQGRASFFSGIYNTIYKRIFDYVCGRGLGGRKGEADDKNVFAPSGAQVCALQHRQHRWACTMERPRWVSTCPRRPGGTFPSRLLDGSPVPNTFSPARAQNTLPTRSMWRRGKCCTRAKYILFIPLTRIINGIK